MVSIKRFVGALALAVLGTGLGCAGDVDEVDRVQPAYVKKSELSGSWYYRRTVVDTGENFGAYASIGTGDLFTIERIRWNIQEKVLYAHRDYEWTPGTEGLEEPGKTDYLGTPVAAFPIIGHFDIIYEYNPETGERSNVRVENASDRQWFEREFMRVDWSKNGNPNLDFIIPVDFLDENRVGGGDFYVHEDDATNPWRARVTPERGYMDFVVDHIVVPDPYTCLIDYEFDVYDALNCGESEIRVRHAFSRVDDAKQAGYDPLYYPDSVPLTEVDPVSGQRVEITDPDTGEVVREPIFERFSFYRLERLTYDRERDLTETGRLYRILRFDMWKQSVDAAGNVIPYAQRQVEPIVYHINWDFPEKLKATAGEVAAEWNRVFKQAVASIQGRPYDDGRCGGGTDPDCAIPDVFILKENACNPQNLHNFLNRHPTVKEQAEEAMGKALSRKNKSGDYVVAWPGAEAVELDLLDNWCAAAEYFSRDMGEDAFTWVQEGDPRYNMLNYITKITPSGFAGYGPMLADPVNGRIVTATANIMGWTIENAATRALEYVDYMNGLLTLDDLLLGHDVPLLEGAENYNPRAHTYAVEDALRHSSDTVPAEHLAELRARMQSLGATPADRMVPLENSSYYAERIARVQGTDLEREYLIRPEDLMLASRGQWAPGMPVSDELWDQASFFTRRAERMSRRTRTERLFSEHTFCTPLALDSALVGLAKKLEDVADRDARRDYILKAYFKAVALHEIGHNVGLRHNFAGSYDALNYIPTFWDLEASTLSTDEKLEAGQPEFTYSSIMDYHGKMNGDWQGLGAYDAAAVKFGYGQMLETFADPTVTGGKTMKRWLEQHDYRELIGPSDIDGFEDNHPPYFSSVDQISNREDVRWDWSTVTDRAQVQTLLNREVPYLMCSDEYNQVTPICKTFDFGANQREVQAAAYVNYKNYFIFSRFLRNRLTLDWNRALMRGQLAFMETNLTYKWMYYYLNQDLNGFGQSDRFADMATATARGLNLMSEVLALPSPSVYHRCVLNEGTPQEDTLYRTSGWIDWDPLVDPTMGLGPDNDPASGVTEVCYLDDELDVNLGEGFPVFFGFSEDYVLWTFTYLGTYWDKIAALDQMTDPYAWFPRVNHEEDFSTYSVSLYRLYPEEVNDILLGLVEMDRRSLASQFDVVNHHDADLVPRAMVPIEGVDPTKPKVQPSLVRNMQLYAVLFGMAFLTSPLDETLDFSKHTRVAIKGSAYDFAAFDSVPAADRAECMLPESGRTYRALRTASEGSRIDIAFNFVEECEVWVDRFTAAEQIYLTEKATLDAMSESDPGYATQEDLVDDLRYERNRADGELRTIEQLLIYMNRIQQMYEFGVGY